MLRKVGPSLLHSCTSARLLFSSRAMCTDGFKSAYNWDKLYPSSDNINNNINYNKLTSQNPNHRHAHNQAESSEAFSGQIPVDKLTVKYSRSSGPGGQHVNKVNTKAEVRFHVATAEWLPQHIRDKITEKKQNRINKAGELIMMSERTRSQMTNFADCLQKIRDTVVEVTKKPKEPTLEDGAVKRVRIEAANRERLKQKKMRSTVKRDRQVFAD